MKIICNLRFTCIAVVLFALCPNAEAQERVVYKEVGKDFELAINIYNPKGWKVDDSRPAIVFFFGGGWRGGVDQAI